MPPRFSQNYYTVDVDENVQPEFVVMRVAVYDDDSLGGLQLTLNVGSEVNLKINEDGKNGILTVWLYVWKSLGRQDSKTMFLMSRCTFLCLE